MRIGLSSLSICLAQSSDLKFQWGAQSQNPISKTIRFWRYNNSHENHPWLRCACGNIWRNWIQNFFSKWMTVVFNVSIWTSSRWQLFGIGHWEGNQNSESGLFKGNKLGVWSVEHLPVFRKCHNIGAQPRNLLPPQPNVPTAPSLIFKSENPDRKRASSISS